MIARIKGKIVELKDNALLLDVQGITYRVFVPAASLQRIGEHTLADNTIELVTFHYYQSDPSRSIPVLIGFLNEIEQEFFEAFMTTENPVPLVPIVTHNRQDLVSLARLFSLLQRSNEGCSS